MCRLSKLNDRKAHRTWHTLMDPSGRENLGEVEICIRWWHSHAHYYEVPSTLRNATKAPGEKNELCVLVIRAKGLAAKDRANLLTGSAASSDPFVKLQYADQSFETKTIEKNTNPVFMEVFKFAAEDLAVRLDVLVADADFGGRADFLGRCCIDLSEVLANKCVRRAYFKLCDESGNSMARLGTIELFLAWIHNPARVVLVDDLLVPSEDLSSTEPPNELCVFVLRARRLRAMDRNMLTGKLSSDPYIVLQIRGNDASAVRTSAKKKTLCPIWQEAFTLPVEAPVGEELLDVSVFDYDTAKSHDFIGGAVVYCSSLPAKRRVRRWFQLAGKPGSGTTTCGEVELALLWRFNPNRVLALPDKFTVVDTADASPTVLLCTVIRAKRLRACDATTLIHGKASSDPYCILELDGETRKTSVKMRELYPIWQELFELPCDFEGATLRVTLKDHDMLGTDEVMGSCKIPIVDKSVVRAWYDLGEGNGQIELATRWVHDPSAVVPLPSDFVDEAPSRPPNELIVAVLRARNLLASATRGLLSSHNQTPSPSVELHFGTFEPLRTSPKKHATNASWLEVFRFSLEQCDLCNPGDADLALTLHVLDHGKKGNTLGTAEFKNLKMLEDRRPRRTWKVLTTNSSDPECRSLLEVALLWGHNRGRVYDLPAHMLQNYDDDSKQPNTLCVALLRARNVPVVAAARRSSLSLAGKKTWTDPFCVLTVCGDVEFKSRVHRKTQNPDFGAEYFEMLVEENDPSSSRLKVELLDYNGPAHAPTFIGDFYIELDQAASRGRALRAWYSANRARVELAVLWRYDDAHCLKMPALLADAEPFPNIPTNTLRVCVFRAKNLPESTRRVSVTLVVASGERQHTSTKLNTRYPVWLEQISLSVHRDAVVKKHQLEVAIYDSGTSVIGSRTRVGVVYVPLRACAHRRTAHRHWYDIANDDNNHAGKIELGLRLVFDPDNPNVLYDPRSEDDMARLSADCIKAARDVDLELLRRLVECGVSASHVRTDGNRTLAHEVASRHGGDATLAMLKDLGVDLDHVDDRGETAVHVAVRHNRAPTVRRLALLGATLTVADNYGKRPAHVACEAGSNAALKMLAVLGARLDEQTWNGKTPAHLAAEHSHVTTLDMLHDLGANLDARGADFGGRTPLHCAAAAGSIAAISKLISFAASLESRDHMGLTPALSAAMHNQRAAVDFLVSHGANEECADHEGNTPQAYLRQHGSRTGV